MDITFSLGGLDVDIHGERVSVGGGAELTIDGLVTPHVSTVLKQLWEQYLDLGADDLVARKITVALQAVITLADGKEFSGEDIEDLANTLAQ